MLFLISGAKSKNKLKRLRSILTLSQTTNFRTFQTERDCRQQFQTVMKMAENYPKGKTTPREKERLLITSNF